MSGFKIEKGIPEPSRSKYPFGDMAVGDSFEFDAHLRHTVSSRASHYGKRYGMRFTTRIARIEGDKGRCWRVS